MGPRKGVGLHGRIRSGKTRKLQEDKRKLELVFFQWDHLVLWYAGGEMILFPLHHCPHGIHSWEFCQGVLSKTTFLSDSGLS